MKTLETLAVERGLILEGKDFVSAGEFADVGIPMISSCFQCEETLAPYNAYVCTEISHYGIFCRQCCPENKES